MHVGTSLSAILLSICACSNAFPTSESSRVPENAGEKSVGRLAFTLADPNGDKAADAPPGGSFMDIVQALTKSSFFQKFVQYLGGVAAPQQNSEPKKIFGTRQLVPQADLPEAARHFEASLSHDDAIETVASGTRLSTAITAPEAAPKSITDEGFSHLLFGEKGVLTNVFHMMDAQRQNEQASKAEQARRAQADPGNAKIKDMDFAKVFDTLLMGGQKKNEFGEPGPELPENKKKYNELQFLGICNRLSCGDIYKAIDEFRRSEFFSNFQTAMQLMQDPKGWEIIGKMLSNPELISSFTGGAGEVLGGVAGGGAGAGLGGMLGSALGGAKAAVAKEGGDAITSKDGDFGTDFSSVAKLQIDKDQFFKGAPETSFSIDEGAKGEGAGEDYYSEIVSNIDEDFEVEDKDILGLPTKAASTTTTFATAPTTSPVSATGRPTTLAAATAAVPMLLPKKGEQIPMPEIEFNIDEDYGTTIEENIDAMPPSQTVDQKIPANATAKVSNPPIQNLELVQN
ncbi:hypothetical protein PFISCL1PPCAC_22747 [Pristionchus fissidentatus]|uniref:Uncharacterized protein n=1 Tax=Pristionchus fissidentatus TaxID=1538716 RepID=A0AAV5WLJ8_9BILA|nr:hypothetical protein PFISCL1PPCAC_22747 [Pristionchus fissidentatus]